jgi:ferredoxin
MSYNIARQFPRSPAFMLKSLFHRETSRRQALAAAQVVPEPIRCVQCGICSFNCPISIDVRRHAMTGTPVVDRHCITCGECIARCPRGVLRFDRLPTLPPDEDT